MKCAIVIVIALVSAFMLVHVGGIREEYKQTVRDQLQDEIPEDSFQYAAPWDRALYDGFYHVADSLGIDEQVKGGIVPHHLLAGSQIATFFETLEPQDPTVVVLVGPNHFSQGKKPVISTNRDWKTIYGQVRTSELVGQLEGLSVFAVDEAVVKEEHSIYSIVPFIARSFPDAKVLPLVIDNSLSDSQEEALAERLFALLPEDTIIVASIDFSHYQDAVTADFHDARTIAAITSGDRRRALTTEIDAPRTLSLLMRMMRRYGTERITTSLHTNAAEIVGNRELQDITSYYTPFFVTGKPVDNRIVSILHVGDIMLDRQVRGWIHDLGIGALLDRFAREEGRFFRGIDIVKGNLEGPIVEARATGTRESQFQFDLADVRLLKRYGFTHLNIANNHSYDAGRYGVTSTLEIGRRLGFVPFGEPSVVTSTSYIIENVGGISVAMIGIEDIIYSISVSDMVQLVEKLDEEVDHVIVDIHWGKEYELVSNERQRAVAHALIDAGADLIIGHHPHVVQELEIYRGRLIAYSLGNFLFDQLWSPETQIGLALGTVFDEEGMGVYLFPYHTARGELHHYEDAERQLFFADLKKKSHGLPSSVHQDYVYLPYE